MISAVYRGWRIAEDLKQSYGIDAYLEKPFQISDLVGAVETALSQRPARRAASRASPPRPRRSSHEGIDAYQAGDIDAAIEHLREGTRIDPLAYRLHFHLGLLYGKKGHVYDGIQELENALDLNPEHFPALKNLAVLYEKAGFRNKAIEAWERALRSPRTTPPASRSRSTSLGCLSASRNFAGSPIETRPERGFWGGASSRADSFGSRSQSSVRCAGRPARRGRPPMKFVCDNCKAKYRNRGRQGRRQDRPHEVPQVRLQHQGLSASGRWRPRRGLRRPALARRPQPRSCPGPAGVGVAGCHSSSRWGSARQESSSAPCPGPQASGRLRTEPSHRPNLSPRPARSHGGARWPVSPGAIDLGRPRGRVHVNHERARARCRRRGLGGRPRPSRSQPRARPSGRPANSGARPSVGDVGRTPAARADGCQRSASGAGCAASPGHAAVELVGGGRSARARAPRVSPCRASSGARPCTRGARPRAGVVRRHRRLADRPGPRRRHSRARRRRRGRRRVPRLARGSVRVAPAPHLPDCSRSSPPL